MKQSIVLILITLITACGDNEKQEAFVDPADYEIYLGQTKTSSIENLKRECDFWTGKIKEVPNGFLYYQKLGAASMTLFEKTGDVNYLDLSERSFDTSSKLVQGKYKASSLLTQSSLAIKQHLFNQANHYALMAREHTNEKFASYMMQFDSEMELGNFELAKSILDRNPRFDSFDFLVRLSKFKDYEGDLDSAIIYMERAYQMVKQESSSRATWAAANLGDMYGHSGKIQAAYQKYLEVLQRDPSYDYALKGIAWIAYSADGNLEEADRILTLLDKRTMLPDNYLLLAEIAEAQGKESKRKGYIGKFLDEAGKEKYGGMYNKYLINIYSDELNEHKKAIELASQEVLNRSTPATNDWLAWAYYRSGQTQKALEVYGEQVEGKTFEPEVLYHMGLVYYTSGKRAKGLALLNECLDASFELGPHTTQRIKKELSHTVASL